MFWSQPPTTIVSVSGELGMALEDRYGTVDTPRLAKTRKKETSGPVIPLLSIARGNGISRSAQQGEGAPLQPFQQRQKQLKQLSQQKQQQWRQKGLQGHDDDNYDNDGVGEEGTLGFSPSRSCEGGVGEERKGSARGVFSTPALPAGFALVTLMTLLALLLTMGPLPRLFNLADKPVDSGYEYDFIVVGGGPAGSVLAKRLSDDLQNRVLLLEAGMPSQYELGGEDFLSYPLTPFDIPLMWSSVSHMKDFHWEINDHTRKGHPSALVAKALGGCGIHNAMLYVRGLESDFVKWDVEGFDYASAVKIWKENENYTGPGVLPDWHGRGGPISTTPPSFIDEVAPFFVESCENAGINFTVDFNKPKGREGVGYYHFAVKNGVRDSAARAMLGDIITDRDVRQNLDIVTGALANKVLIDVGHPVSMDSSGDRVSETPAAVGVEYLADGKVQTARIAPSGSLGRAGSAVIVTAGALNTPKLLMKSGVGDREELASHKLGCLSHVPELGNNLQDHSSVGVMYMLGPDLLKLMPSAYTVAQELEKYKIGVLKAFDLGFPPGVTQDGVDSDLFDSGEVNQPSIFSSAGLSAGAFLKSPYRSHPAGDESVSAPDIQLTLFPRVTEPHILALANIRPSAHAPPMMLVTVSLLDPEGRSTVRLDPADPHLGNPYIDRDSREGALKPLTELDSKKLAWGVGQVRKIMRTSPLKELHRGEVYPGPGVSGGTSDNAGEDPGLINWVGSFSYSNSHWCGTARMGKKSDPKSVVDEKMAVKGVKGLHVGDASVIPFIPNGNVHSAVVLVATKLAEILLAGASSARKEDSSDDAGKKPGG